MSKRPYFQLRKRSEKNGGAEAPRQFPYGRPYDQAMAVMSPPVIVRPPAPTVTPVSLTRTSVAERPIRGVRDEQVGVRAILPDHGFASHRSAPEAAPQRNRSSCSARVISRIEGGNTVGATEA